MNEQSDLPEIQKIISLELALIPVNDTGADWMNSLVQRINYLILHDFDRLVFILYRLDVDESKINLILKNTQLQTSPGSDAGVLIGKLIVERQIQKLRTRTEYRNQKNSFNDNERW